MKGFYWQLMLLVVPGMVLLAIGWATANYYAIIIGSVLLCGAVATLTLPRPPTKS
jgi:hypothetical protein